MPQDNKDHKDSVWTKGEFFGSLNEVKQNMKSYSLDAKYIKGFYEESLTEELAQEKTENPQSIIHIDVDL